MLTFIGRLINYCRNLFYFFVFTLFIIISSGESCNDQRYFLQCSRHASRGLVVCDSAILIIKLCLSSSISVLSEDYYTLYLVGFFCSVPCQMLTNMRREVILIVRNKPFPSQTISPESDLI